MPIVLILLLTASCAELPWPEPPFGFGGSGSLALTAFAFLIPVGAAFVLSRWTASAIKADPSRRNAIAARYDRHRRRLGYLTLVVGVLAVSGLGWGWTVWHRVVEPYKPAPFAPLAELLVPAPYLIAVFASWLLHYDVERLFHGFGPAGEAFGSRAGYFVFKLRSYAIQVLLPVVLFAGFQTFARLVPELADNTVVQLLEVGVMLLLFVLLPLVLRPVLGLTPMPPGPTRERLEGLARKLNFRYSNLLLWSTRGAMANAMIVGFVPWARYVVFTDRLLDTLTEDEVDAVFGHEVGHAKHSHIPYYAGFFLLSTPLVALLVAMLFNQLAMVGWIDAAAWKPWAGLPSLTALMVYIFLVFGYLSRRCERQADLYGCRMETAGERISANGIDAMMRALTRVADLNGLDARTGQADRGSTWQQLLALLWSWQHGSIPERIRFLAEVKEQPELDARVQWRVFVLRTALMTVLLAGIAAFIALVGWETVRHAL